MNRRFGLGLPAGGAKANSWPDRMIFPALHGELNASREMTNSAQNHRKPKPFWPLLRGHHDENFMQDFCLPLALHSGLRLLQRSHAETSSDASEP